MKKNILIIVIAVAILFAAGSIYLVKNYDVRYSLSEKISKIGKSAKLSEIENDSINFNTYSLDEIKNNDKIEFNNSLMLINSEYSLSDDFKADIGLYKDSDVYMDKCVFSAYERLSSDISERFAQKLYIMDAYRSYQSQADEYDMAEDKASVANPGESEHQAGLALDVYIKQFAGLSFLKTDVGKFVNSECWKYGFAIRYPMWKEDITKITFEPWHIRYVGEPHAEIMYKNNLCLEEYLELFEIGALYKYSNYLIYRQNNDNIIIPDSFKACTVSPDNKGCFLICVEFDEIV